MKKIIAAILLLPVMAQAHEWYPTEEGCQVWHGSPQSGERVSWSGECVEGMANGEGILVRHYVAADHDVTEWFRGTMVDGTLIYGGLAQWDRPPGYQYVGDYKGGKYNGQGTYYYPNGDRYEGQWTDNESNGPGADFFSDGSWYIGEYENDLRSGQGTYNYHNENERYEGAWSNDLKNGLGIYYYADGSRYEGNWVDGIRSGQGTQYWDNGDRYVGEFESGNIHGEGVFIMANEGKQVGRFEGNQFWNGWYYFPDGTSCEVEGHEPVVAGCFSWD